MSPASLVFAILALTIAAFGSLLGGALTLIGTPPDLVVSQQLVASGGLDLIVGTLVLTPARYRFGDFVRVARRGPRAPRPRRAVSRSARSRTAPSSRAAGS